MTEKYIEFSLFNQENIDSTPILIESKTGIDQSVKSLSLGSTSFIQICSTCSLTDLCPGHYGKFAIEKPIFKVIFKKEIEFLLKNICPKCGMIKNSQIISLLQEIYNNGNIITENHKKKFNNILIENKQYNKQTKTKCKNDFCQSVTTSIQYNSKNNYFTYNTNIKEVCDMQNLYKYFAMLPSVLLKLMNNNNIIEPKDVFYYKYLLIPSNYIRQPNIYKDISFDPFTTELNALIKVAKKSNFIDNKKVQVMFDSIDNNQGDNPYSGNKKKLNLSILTNGNNKDSYLRSNINGKRVIGTGRAVISPGNPLKIGEIEIPEYILNTLRENVFFNKITKKYILDSISSNKNEFIDYIKVNLSKINIYSVVSLLNNYKILAPKYGDQFEKRVQRHQYMMFGRQPSIHPWNSQAGEIIKDSNEYPDKFERTINIPTAIAPSQNADYDGDEILIKKFNGATSNIELGLIMNSKKLLKHPVTGTTMYGLVQDQIVGFNMLLQEKSISYNKACLILGNYIYFLEEIKEVYTGRDIISYIFPKYYTYENTFQNGRIIVKHITSNMVSANSYTSIFNELSHVYGNDYVIAIIDIVKEIIQNYVKYYGLSILFTNLVPNIELLNEIKEFVSNIVGKANDKIKYLIEDLNNEKFHISSYNDVLEIKVKNINVINEKTQEFMKYILDKYYTQEDNLFVLCYNMGYKVSINDLINILCFVGQKTNKTMPYPKLNGKTYLYDLQNNINLESSGFITNSYITGLTYSQYVVLVKEESLPQIVNVTSGTSQAGSAGKKILRIASELVLNYDKFVVSCKHIINFNPNFLKISAGDIIKVNLVLPNKKLIWYKTIKEIFDTNIREFLYKNKSKSIIIKKQVSFYINIKSEILMYYYKNINTNPNTKLVVNHDKNFSKINNFYKYINTKYYFNLNELSYVLYLFLIYFDPSEYVFELDDVLKLDKTNSISNYFTDELLNIVFDKILFKLNYSLSPGFMFGYYIGNTLQERFTQQTLSSFHATTKGGGSVQKGATEEFKQLLELSKKDEDIVVCNSYDYNIINNIKSHLEHISLKIICNNIELVEENDKNYVYCCDISLSSLLQKGIDMVTLYKMVKTYCDKCFSIQEYYIYFKLSDKDLKLYINVVFNTNIKNVAINKNILKSYFKVSLWDGIHKGKQMNTNLFIENMPVDVLNDKDEIENKTMYSIKFFIETVYDMKNINTAQLDSIYITPWMSYNIGGIHYMKINTLGKVENIINDDNFIHCLKHFFDFRFGTNKPMNIKSLYNKEEIIKQANHGNSNIISHAAFKNYIDHCTDIYSSLLVSQTPNIGTNYYNFYINPNLFDKYKYISETKIIKDEKIISIL
jgi:DNA-directed RNA polymerase beta' subunit